MLCFFNHFSTRITFFWFLRKAKSPGPHLGIPTYMAANGGLCGPRWGLRNSTCSVPWRSNFSRLSSSTVNWSVSFSLDCGDFVWRGTLQGTNISPKNGILKMIFLFPRWDMLIPWRVISGLALYIGCHSPPRISKGTLMRFHHFLLVYIGKQVTRSVRGSAS